MILRLVNILLFLLIWQSQGLANQDYTKKYFFAVGIFTGAHSQILSYAIITKSGEKTIGTQIIREQSFMYYIMGYWPTKANPLRENLLEQNGVDSCFLTKNYSNKINGYYIKPFYELWKVRYKLHPFKHDFDDGWSQEYYKPSYQQAVFLNKHYGISNVKTQYFVGDSLFKLLRDVQKEDWIVRYSAIRDSI
jgi:hypothetical protein